MPAKSMDELVALCKRRGFIFSQAIYTAVYRESTTMAHWA